MYQSLYRKYRPQTFEEVVGQKVIIRILKNVILKNKISHAYLFTGPRGTGKTSVAKILAKTINCVNLMETTPCDKCVSCTQIKNKQSIDIIEIDAASNNGVDEIRELKSKVSLVPSTSKYKVYIIDEVHMLTIGAFNALLKTLEEPPAHIIFILATTEPHKIPETILSRCQKFEFRKIDEKSMYERLNYICIQEKIEITEKALKEIIRFSSGGIRDAICLLEQVHIYSESKITIDNIHEINGTLPQIQLKQLIINIINKDLVEIFKLIEQYDGEGKNLIKLIEEVILFFKNLIICQNINDYADENISREIYEDLINKISTKELLEIIMKINNALIEMKEYGNPKMIFELLVISLVSNKKEITEQHIENQQLNEKKKENKNLNEEESINNSEDNIEILKKIKEIRINNTFSGASRSELNKVKKEIEISKNYILDELYGKIASLLLDAKITAVSSNNIVFSFPSIGMRNNFNNNILKIEDFVFKLFNKKYQVIAVDEKEWFEYRKEFKSKTKKYENIVEDDEITEFLKGQIKNEVVDDKIHNLFKDIIVYDERKGENK